MPLGFDDIGRIRLVDVNILGHIGWIGPRAVDAELRCRFDRVEGLVLDGIQFRFLAQPFRGELVAPDGDGIARVPGLFLGLGAVGPGIAAAVTIPAVGLGLDNGHLIVFAGPLGGLAHRQEDRGRVLAIDDHRRDVIGRRTHRDVFDVTGTQRAFDLAAREGHAHAVEVVFDDGDQRDLQGRGHIHRLMEGAGIGGAVAEEGHHDLAGLLALLRQGGPDGGGLIAADNAGRAQVVLLVHLGNVHRTAATLAVAGLFAHQFGHHGVPVVLPVGVAVGILVADSPAVPVPTVGRADHVAPFDRRRSAGGHRLFSGIKVRGALDDVLAQQLEDFFLEEANLIDGSQPVLGVLKADHLLADQFLYLGYGLPARILDGVLHDVNSSFKSVPRSQ